MPPYRPSILQVILGNDILSADIDASKQGQES